MFQPNPISTYSLFSRVGGSVLFHRFNVDDYYLFLLFPFFSKVFLHRNWLVLLFRSYLLSMSLVSKPLVKVLFFASKHFWYFVTTILLCKVSTDGVGKGTHPAYLNIFFRLFGCSCSLIKNSQSPRGENNIGYLLPCSPAFCLLVFST